MEDLKSLIQNLCDADKEWSSTIQKYIKENVEPQNKEIIKSFDRFMSYTCEKYKENPEELVNELNKCLDKEANWIVELIENTLYAYVRLREYRKLIKEDEEKGKQLLKYVFDNTIVRYDPDFHLQYK